MNGALGNSLAVQWLELCTFTAKGLSSIPGQGTKILQAMWYSFKEKGVKMASYRSVNNSKGKMYLQKKKNDALITRFPQQQC